MEATVNQLRLALYLDGPFDARPYAKRPPCRVCNRSVKGRSFHHLANGVICHLCLYGPRKLYPYGHGAIPLAQQNKLVNWFMPALYSERIESHP